MDQLLNVLIGLIVALAGYGAYQRSRKNQAEALNDTIEVKTEINDVTAKQDVNDAKLQAEEELREKLAKDAKDEKSNNDNLTDFFNKQ